MRWQRRSSRRSASARCGRTPRVVPRQVGATEQLLDDDCGDNDSPAEPQRREAPVPDAFVRRRSARSQPPVPPRRPSVSGGHFALRRQPWTERGDAPRRCCPALESCGERATSSRPDKGRRTTEIATWSGDERCGEARNGACAGRHSAHRACPTTERPVRRAGHLERYWLWITASTARRKPRGRFPVGEPARVPCKENRSYPISTTPEIG